MEKRRKYVQIFREWWEPLSGIDDKEEKLTIMEMVMNYAFNGKEPTKNELSNLSAVGVMYWNLTFPNLRSSRKNYENGCKSNGAPKGSRNAAKFLIPTLDEVKRYFDERGYESAAERFFDFNESIGWASTKKHFKSWQQAADRWVEKGEEFD